MVLVDTDILIDAGRNIAEALACLNQLEERSPLAISAITQMELMAGGGNKNELASLELFIDNFQVIHVNRQVSEAAAGLLKNTA